MWNHHQLFAVHYLIQDPLRGYRASPRSVVFCHPLVDADLLLDTTLCGHGLCHYMARVAHMCFLVLSWVFLGCAPPGPYCTKNVQEHEVNGVRGAPGCGVLMWECAHSLANGNIFFSVPLGSRVEPHPVIRGASTVRASDRAPKSVNLGMPLLGRVTFDGLPQPPRLCFGFCPSGVLVG